ncbi:uncharacterized protein ARMOST_20197 [Armillaria ostoyae]|uniref:Uncharacterized protein n=1 Tax=Armillaria ostoyae TaxID=47428 RepID=A0A284S6N4_ARMOS|nr:uncharacterized protein ARMOST_20197 [Armillaria ostoyae]
MSSSRRFTQDATGFYVISHLQYSRECVVLAVVSTVVCHPVA